MRKARVFGQVLGVQGMVVGDVTVQTDPDGDEEILVVSVRPDARSAGRCATCRRRCPGYDAGVGSRRWRTVDTGTTRTFLQAAAPRVRCPEHGVLVAHVPWARPGAKSTFLLEDTCAWLVKNMALSAVAVFLRLSWRTVTGIVARVVADLTGTTDQLAGLRRIGIDEIAHRYVGDRCQVLRGDFRDEFPAVWRMGLKVGSGGFVVEAVEESVEYFLPADLSFGCGVVALAL